MSRLHTPGPWKVITHVDAADHGRRVVGSGRVVAECGCMDPETNDANARLIAEAPRMADLLADIPKKCSVEMADDRLDYITVQMPRSLAKELGILASDYHVHVAPPRESSPIYGERRRWSRMETKS